MGGQHVIHIVEPDDDPRARIAELVAALGHRAQVYGAIDEVTDFQPDRGVVLVRDCEQLGGIASAIRRLTARSVWLPVIAMAERPGTRRIVAAVRAGALDYLDLPLTREALGEAIERVASEAEAHAAAQRRLAEARRHIGALTRREREVLDLLTEGLSNKAIARALAISPRTVEIHRANMMAKLGARHPADAVRIRLDART